ncbi:nucleoside-diphosphate-sugar epimerase [Desulfobaculum xiamenense]|uniref:Nucleoside-diphosphate-sugar epimerase n=1 Tax=Desulfobaculum xiamenense TaxID=995050 RepID=A0A846QLM3_9BACT|nr:NAD(P)-dependent oxidoreductase [Desulfobaculum xiamenense]NJB67093.1 nucleoside-diphosphate-sugar epimerase [Desulfobaculum xiamenense]
MTLIPFKGRRIALIGGAGFIGHNLALRLRALGAEVSIIDSLMINNLLTFASTATDVPNRDIYLDMLNARLILLRQAGIPLFVQDCRDYNALSKLIARIDPQVVVQLAAVAHANKSNKDPYSTFDHSFRTLENALDCSRDRVEHFIYFSSSMVYGHFRTGTVMEDTQCEPLGIYGALKFGGEKLVIAYNQAFGLPYTIIRPSALYGERCVSRRVGQIFIESALRGDEIRVLGDGSDRLDFTYIDDFVNGMLCVLENENSRNQIFNITYGESRSLGNMADLVREHFPGARVRYVPKDNLTPDRGTLCVDKARELIGYRPEWPLERGFVKYIQWYKHMYADGNGGSRLTSATVLPGMLPPEARQ